MRSIYTWFAASLLVIHAGACSKKADDKAKAGSGSEAPDRAVGGDKPTPDKAATPDAAPAAPKAADIPIDADLMAAMKAIAATCTVDAENGNFTCANGEDTALATKIGEKQPTDLLPTYAVALGDADPKLQTVGVKQVYSISYSGSWGLKPGAVTKDVARLLLAKVPTLPMYPRRQTVNAMMFGASLADLDAEAYAVLEAHDDEYFVSSGWIASTKYGRLKPFDKLDAMAKSGDPKKLLTAVTAINDLVDPTADENAKICPWGAGYLGADAPEVDESEIFEQAGYIVTGCRGEWVDKLLAFGEEQRAKNRFDRRYYFVFRDLCFGGFMGGEQNANATEAQCEANFAFLEKVVNTEGVPAKGRAFALDAISYQRRDEKSLKLMKKYVKSKVPEIKTTAEEAVKMLEEHYVK